MTLLSATSGNIFTPLFFFIPPVKHPVCIVEYDDMIYIWFLFLFFDVLIIIMM